MRDAGRIGFVLKGDYDNTTSYEFLDVVYFEGASYVAKKDTLGNEPVYDNEYWHILSGITDLKPSFAESTERNNINSKESLGVLFGKIKKWFTDLKNVAFTGSFNDLEDVPDYADKSLVGVEYDSSTNLTNIEYAYPDLSSNEVLINAGSESLNKGLKESTQAISNKVLNVYEGSVHKPSILNTSEQISANTSSENVSGALALKEMSSALDSKITKLNSDLIPFFIVENNRLQVSMTGRTILMNMNGATNIHNRTPEELGIDKKYAPSTYIRSILIEDKDGHIVVFSFNGTKFLAYDRVTRSFISDDDSLYGQVIWFLSL